VCSSAALALVLAGAHARAESPIPAAPSQQAASQVQDTSLDSYRQHLLDLSASTESCAQARDARACDPALVGPDDRVPLTGGANTEPRVIRYHWLRALFLKAQDRDAEAAKSAAAQPKDAEESAEPVPPTTSELLKAAESRLAHDLDQANTAAAASPSHGLERETMKQVLAGRAFRTLEARNPRDSAVEKFGDWLNRLFLSAARLRSRSAWIGRVIVCGFILAICSGLVWGLLRLERRWRVRLTPESGPPAPGAASARDWQLWLNDARQSAAAGAWREAMHSVYWAAISRLESKRLWPADRARTPREYLALLAPDDPRRTALAALTRGFERTWYGGRPAAEADYRQAERVAEGLIAGGKAPGGDAQ
jgi:hypothetical protein